jgi:hypothetical protein
MNEAELRQVLNGAHETIASDGANKTEPGAFKGTGARSNRGSDHRVLHFKDGDAWMAYMEAFGEGSLYDAMLGHIGKMARDVALVERHGPNPEQWFRVQSDTAERADGVGTMANRAAGNTPQAYWDTPRVWSARRRTAPSAASVRTRATFRPRPSSVARCCRRSLTWARSPPRCTTTGCRTSTWWPTSAASSRRISASFCARTA